MPKYRMHGYDTLKNGACGADGAMGGSLSELKAIVPDSVIFDVLEPEVAEIEVEGTDEPDIMDIIKGGLKSVSIQTRDLSTDNLETFFGGTTSVGVWSAPVKTVKKFQSVELVGKYVEGERILIKIPKALIIAKMVGNLKDTDSGILDIKFKIATPVDAAGAALSPFSVEYETEP